jgi:hypothetical protein
VHADVVEAESVLVVSESELEVGTGPGRHDYKLQVCPDELLHIDSIEEFVSVPRRDEFIGRPVRRVVQPKREQIALACQGRQRLGKMTKRVGLAQKRAIDAEWTNCPSSPNGLAAASLLKSTLSAKSTSVSPDSVSR